MSLVIEKLASALTGDGGGTLGDYAQDVAKTTARTTLATGVIGAGTVGAGTYAALKPELVARIAQGLAKGLRIPLAVAAGLASGIFLGKNVGIPAGVLLGASTAPHGKKGRPPSQVAPLPPEKSQVEHMLGL